MSIINHVDTELDSLLDEVESRYILSPSKSPLPSLDTPHREEIDIEVEMLLEDIKEIEKFSISSSTRLQPAMKQHKPNLKCDQLYLAGTYKQSGVSSNSTIKACDNIRCTSCDFIVISIDNKKWTKSADYLFFRNHMPDKSKLLSETKVSRGVRAYACQCTWISVQDILKVTDKTSLKSKWVCGKHNQ
eukprot:TRINITY_DN7461_c0_g1_i1.p1 TRINITY_DN7461_c0_g1~~TRINITY_DN7461_c0_g1_i1.p1  ORF type:complete len:188 (-),score=27.65 TRINITY_DN7461_c0_g1_i1:12-575(-)